MTIQTVARDIERRGQYTRVELWSDKQRYKVMLDRYLNIISIHRFVRSNDPKPWFQFWSWRQEWNRAYKRRRPFGPLHTDLITCAVQHAKEKRYEVK